MSELFIPTLDDQTKEHLFHPYIADGWHFGAGNPEFWKFADQLVVPGGKALEIGCGRGRNVLFFATQGMDVTAIDVSSTAVESATITTAPLFEATGTGANIVLDDLMTTELPAESFDTVIMDSLLNHCESEGKGIAAIEKATSLLKPGGHMFLRVVGTEDETFQDNLETNGADDPHVKFVTCGCSGEIKEEPVLYLDPITLGATLFSMGLDIVHQQTITEPYMYNILHGETFRDEWPNFTPQLLTYVLRKA